MNALLWILQVVLALHTVAGAMWKFAGKTNPSLAAIPHGIWQAMIVVELLCAVALILPAFKKSLGRLAPMAAAVLAAEMLIFTAAHLASGHAVPGEIGYWLVVAAICGFVAYGRRSLKPILAAA